MLKFLKRGQQVRLRDGRCVTIIGEINAGGQGIVYRVLLSGNQFALKWYFLGCIDEPQKFYNYLSDNIEVGAPSRAFVWPQQLTEYVAGDTFGYIMRLIPKNYKSFSSFLTANVRFTNVIAMVNAAMNIVAAIKKLHEKGLSYKDLHDENIFIDPTDGKVLICDTDNVTREGNPSKIIGKPNYIAPEVLRGEKMPDRYTDRHSLAVIIFMLLIGDHPLAGKRTMVPILTDRLDRRFFGTEPLFIFDKNDRSNAPHPELHKNALKIWKFFPHFIKNFFQRAFSQEVLLHGATHPAIRPTPQEWLNVLMRLKSSIVRCPICGEEMFLESELPTICYSCKNTFQAVGYLAFNGRQNLTVPIFKNAVMYDYENFRIETAVILERGGRFGLRNDSREIWRVASPRCKFLKNPGEILVLGPNFKIDFGNNTSAEVRVNG